MSDSGHFRKKYESPQLKAVEIRVSSYILSGSIMNGDEIVTPMSVDDGFGDGFTPMDNFLI